MIQVFLIVFFFEVFSVVELFADTSDCDYYDEYASGENSFVGSESPAEMLLALRRTPEGQQMFQEQLSFIAGDMDPDTVDEIMKQLDEMEQGTPEGEAKKREFDAAFSNYEKIFNDEAARESAVDRDIDAHAYLEDEYYYESGQKNTLTQEEIAQDQKEEVSASSWLDVITNCVTPLSKKHKKLFRVGLFEFEAVVKAVHAPNDSLELFDYILDLKLQAELLVMTLHNFRRPLKMRYLFADNDECKNIRSDLVIAIQDFEKIASKFSSDNQNTSPQETVSFLRNWEKRAENRDLSDSNTVKRKNNKNSGNNLSAASKRRRKREKAMVPKIETNIALIKSSNELLQGILGNPKLAAEEAAKRKMHSMQPWLAKRYPQMYDNYNNRLSRASDDYDPYYNYGNYGGSRQSGGYNDWDNYNNWYDTKQANDKAVSSGGTDDTQKSSENRESSVILGQVSEEVLALTNSKLYKDLLALDANLGTLNQNTAKILSESFLTLEFQGLLSKIKSALKETNSSSASESSTNIINEISKNARRDALHKIYRPIYYLNQNIGQIPIKPDMLSKRDATQKTVPSGDILVVPQRRLLGDNSGGLQKSFDTFAANPGVDSLIGLETILSEQSAAITEKKSMLQELLNIPELEPTTQNDIISNTKTKDKANLARENTVSQNAAISAEQIKKRWDEFDEQAVSQATRTLISAFNALQGQVEQGLSDNNNHFATTISSCMNQLAYILCDYPVSKKPFEDQEIKKHIAAFFVNFAESYRRKICQYFISSDEPDVSQESEDDDNTDQKDVFAIHKLLSNFTSVTEALGYQKPHIFVDSLVVDNTRKIMRSTVLLNAIFNDSSAPRSEIQIREDLQIQKNSGWDKIFQNFKVLLNFEDYKTELPLEECRRLWANTNLVSRQAIPFPYLSWCRGSLDKIDVAAFELYNGLCDHLSEIQQPTILESNATSETIDSAKKSFEDVVYNLIGLLGDLLKEEYNDKGRDAESESARNNIANFVIKVLQKILNNNVSSDQAITEEDTPDTGNNYLKLLYAIDMIYEYNIDTEAQRDGVLCDKNYLIEFLALSQVPFSSSRAFSLDNREGGVNGCIKNIENNNNNKDRDEVTIRIDILKKILIWFSISGSSSDDDFITALGISQNINFVTGEQNNRVIKKDVFKATNLTPLDELVALYKPKLLDSLATNLLKDIWALCDTLDAFKVELLKESIGKTHQDQFVAIVDKLINDTTLIPNEISSVATDVRAAALIKQITSDFTTYLQKRLECEDVLSAKTRKEYRNVIDLIENVNSIVESIGPPQDVNVESQPETRANPSSQQALEPEQTSLTEPQPAHTVAAPVLV